MFRVIELRNGEEKEVFRSFTLLHALDYADRFCKEWKITFRGDEVLIEYKQFLFYLSPKMRDLLFADFLRYVKLIAEYFEYLEDLEDE